MLKLMIALVSSYLIGSIPTAFLFVKWIKHIDVRDVGSGNVGATNAARVAGRGIGLAVLLIDVAKGLIPTLLIAQLFLNPTTIQSQLGCGVFAVLGHVFPVFLGFRGGKGVATTIGVLLGTMPSVAGICLGVWIVVFLISRYVSVSSLAAAIVLPFAQLLMRQDYSAIALGLSLTIIMTVKHTSNIKRLLSGEEHGFSRGPN